MAIVNSPTQPEISKFLLVQTSSDSINVSVSSNAPEKKIEIDGIAYLNKLDLSFLGFYDFLRNADNRIFGVRVWIHEIEDSIRRALSHYSLDSLINNGAVTIEFAGGQEEIPERSCDQEFGFNAIYESDSASVLFCFEVTNTEVSGMLTPRDSLYKA